MKRTPTAVKLDTVPTQFHKLLTGAPVLDSSCSPEARVLFVPRDGGYYLKSAPRGTLAREAVLTRYFHQKGLSAAVLDYVSAERDWLLTAAISGEDCTNATYLAEPERLCDLLAERLRALHELDAADCPVQDRMSEYFATAAQNHRKGLFDASYLPPEWRAITCEEAWRRVCEGRALLQNDTLLHGDYCLPNILLDGWRLSGFIDLGNGGVGDRHVDLFWGVWTLAFNLGTDRYGARFLDAYGRDAVDKERLMLVAAAEAFG